MQQETMHPTLHAGEFSELNEKEYRYGKLWKKKSGNNEQHTYIVLFDNIINTFFQTAVLLCVVIGNIRKGL